MDLPPLDPSAPSSYRRLAGEEILKTAQQLARRVEERFPSAGLARVADDLVAVVAETEERCRWIVRPNLPLRLGAAALLVLIVGGLALTFSKVEVIAGRMSMVELIQTLEAGINDVVLIGLAVAFLVTVENRIKRSRALAALHQLRAIAHVVDMHQLTKDPERAVSRKRAEADTPSSPKRTLTPFELARYLDYCAEMLALVSKTAALYAQYLNDSVVLASVNEIEALATNLSQKIWQKIRTVEAYRQREAEAGGEG